MPHTHSRPTHKEQAPPLAQAARHCAYLLIMAQSHQSLGIESICSL